MLNRRQFCGLSAASILIASDLAALTRAHAAARQDSSSFFFRDGDRVVMIGDSITEQHLHSNYVESFVRTRFPEWEMAWRNAGIGGDTSTGGNRRAQRDILSFHPTAVTITFGMNDAGYGAVKEDRLLAYRTGLQGILDQLRGKVERVAVLSSSPVEKKEDGKALEGYNQTLEVFAANAREIALKNDVRFVDQFHPHLAVLQKARDADPANRINGGDAVHPGPSGQYLMASAILVGLNAPRLVSTAVVHSKGGKATSVNCTITKVKRGKKSLAFTRADKALPWWIDPAARSINKWTPLVTDLDEYTLRVGGLKSGEYHLTIDDQKVATFTADQLANGVDLALLTEGPIAAQSKAVHDAVFAKNKYYHDQIYRGVTLNNRVPESDKAATIEERMKGMPALEKAISEALVLKPHRFEIISA